MTATTHEAIYSDDGTHGAFFERPEETTDRSGRRPMPPKGSTT